MSWIIRSALVGGVGAGVTNDSFTNVKINNGRRSLYCPHKTKEVIGNRLFIIVGMTYRFTLFIIVGKHTYSPLALDMVQVNRNHL